MKLFFLLAALLFLSPGCQEKRAHEQPNFVVIYTDDHRHDAMGYVEGSYARTPNLDKLARGGLIFTQACVTTSICSPSRAALLTGRYGSANGVKVVGSEQGLDEDEVPFPRLLKQQGYATGLIGKWHLKNDPAACGLDYAVYFHSNGPYYEREIQVNGVTEVAPGYLESHMVNYSLAFLDSIRQTGAPFFLFHNTQAAHMNHQFNWPITEATATMMENMELTPPPNYSDSLVGKPDYLKQGRNRKRAQEVYEYDIFDSLKAHMVNYYGAIFEMDSALGRLTEYVEDEFPNTYIFVMGDNGWFLGEHGFTSKVLPYEASIRVPLFIKGPEIPAHITDALALNIDVAPTILHLAGIDLPERIQGKPLTHVWQAKQADNLRDWVYYEAPVSQLGSRPLEALRNKEWKMIRTRLASNPFYELYRLSSDPFEMNNLAAQPEYKTFMDSLISLMDHKRKRFTH